jgi:hypothetical protein
MKSAGRLQNRAPLFDRQPPAVIGEWMDDHNRVLACLDDLIEITDCAVTHC